MKDLINLLSIPMIGFSTTDNINQLPNKSGILIGTVSVCNETIDKIEKDSKDIVAVKTTTAYSEYRKNLSGRDLVIGFKVKNLLKYPSSKMLRISRIVTKECSKVGMVEFFDGNIDGNATFGIVDGKIKEFTCATTPPIKWGEIICP